MVSRWCYIPVCVICSLTENRHLPIFLAMQIGDLPCKRLSLVPLVEHQSLNLPNWTHDEAILLKSVLFEIDAGAAIQTGLPNLNTERLARRRACH